MSLTNILVTCHDLSHDRAPTLSVGEHNSNLTLVFLWFIDVYM